MSLSIAGIVLAGGLSRRMGGINKATIELSGKTMLAHAVERLTHQVTPIAINSNALDIETHGLPLLPDSLKGFRGPLAGILTGLEWAKAAGHTHIISAATDTPFFPDDLLEQFLLANEAKTDRIILATSDSNRHPVFGLWPTSIEDDLKNWFATTDTNKVLAFVHRHDWAMADFPMMGKTDQQLDPFFNINTMDDLAIAEEWLKA